MAFKDAWPCPPGTDRNLWIKTYNAADSRIYRRMGKDASKSATVRASGETRRLALKMLAELVPSAVKTSTAVPPSSTRQAVMNPTNSLKAKTGEKANYKELLSSLPNGPSQVSTATTSNYKISSAATGSHSRNFPFDLTAPPPQKRKLVTEGINLQLSQKKSKESPQEEQEKVYAKVLERKLKEMEALWMAIDEAETVNIRTKAEVQNLYHQLKSATADMGDSIENWRLYRLRNDTNLREN